MNLDMYSHACKPVIVLPADTNEMPLGQRVLDHYGEGYSNYAIPDDMTDGAFYEIMETIRIYKREADLSNMFGMPGPVRPDIEERFFTAYDDIEKRRNANQVVFERARSEDLVRDAGCGQWRNLAPLHAWMECLYTGRGGTAEFNSVTIVVTRSDIDSLERDLDLPILPGRGKYYEERALTDDEREAIVEFISKAREQMDDGYVVLYDSWW